MISACDSAGIIPLRRQRPPPLSLLRAQRVIIILSSLSLFAFTPAASSTPISGNSSMVSLWARNEIIGEPFVSCAADAIYAKWRTRKTFAGGRVSVRFAPNRTCYQVLVTNNQIELLVPHLDCRLQRLRVLAPPGIVVEASVLISFHDAFVSAGDRIFLLKCLHLRDNNTNGGRRNNDGVVLLSPFAKLTASGRTGGADDVTSDIIDDRVQNPQTPRPDLPAATPVECRYEIRSSDGVPREREPLTIGTPLIHEWSCQNTRPNQCLLVTNCVMHSAADVGEEHRLVDAVGCPLYLALMPPLDYVDRTHVRELVRLFAVAERPFIRFQCQLNLVDVPPTAAESGMHAAPCPVPRCNDDVEGSKLYNNTVRRKRHQPIGDRSTITRLIDQSTTQILDAISRRLAVEPFVISSPSDDFTVGEEDATQEAAEIDGEATRSSADDALCFPMFPLLLFMLAAFLAAAFALTLYTLNRLHQKRHLRRTVVSGRTSSAY